MSAFFVAGDRVEILVGAEQAGGTLSLFDISVQPGGGPPLHVHGREDETFRVLEGELTFWVGGESRVVAAGEAAFGPRGVPHRFENRSNRPARMLVAVTPGGFCGYFREVGTPATEGMAAPALDEAAIARLLAPAERYGLRFVQG